MATATEYIIALESDGTEKIADFKLTLGEEFKPFIVLTGDNGAGKTWLLETITLSLLQNDASNDSESSFRFVSHIREGQERRRYSYVSDREEEYKEDTKPYAKLAVYNASRLRIHSENSSHVNRRKGYREETPFSDDRLMLNADHWIKMKILAQRSELAEAGMKVLEKLMPNVYKVDYRKDDVEGAIVQYHTSNGIEFLETLSTGNKVVLALIGDLFFRLWDQQLDIKEVKDLTGIIIIDEIEAHLHPEWQRKFPKLLHEIFPKVQFVVSTHTPMTILGLPKNCVLLHVETSINGEITIEKQDLDYWNMLPQQILTAPLFGLDSLRSLYSENLGEVHTEEDYDQLLKRKEVQDSMRQMLKRLNEKRGKEGSWGK